MNLPHEQRKSHNRKSCTDFISSSHQLNEIDLNYFSVPTQKFTDNAGSCFHSGR